jgi:hypothetical protein
MLRCANACLGSRTHPPGTHARAHSFAHPPTCAAQAESSALRNELSAATSELDAVRTLLEAATSGAHVLGQAARREEETQWREVAEQAL